MKNKTHPDNSSYTCKEYREEMILAGLQRALRNPELPPDERKKLEKEIHELEKKIGL